MIKVERITDDLTQKKALDIRQKVFVEEQNVSAEEEYDEYENESRHFIAYAEEQAVGTARWRFTEKGIKLERFAVLSPFRGRDVGVALVHEVISDVQQHPDYQQQNIYLHAQEQVQVFYAKLGFKPVGERFWEANIPHFKMIFSE